MLEAALQEEEEEEEEEAAPTLEETTTTPTLPSTLTSSIQWDQDTTEVDMSTAAPRLDPLGGATVLPVPPPPRTQAPASLVAGMGSNPYRLTPYQRIPRGPPAPLLAPLMVPLPAPLLAPLPPQGPSFIIDIEEDDFSLPPPSLGQSTCTTCTTMAQKVEALEAKLARLEGVSTTTLQPAGSKAPVTNTTQTTQSEPLPATHITCTKCGQRVSNKKDLMEHLKAVHTLQCPQCRYKCSTIEKLDQHIAEKHTVTNQQQTIPAPVNQPPPPKCTLYLSDSLVKSIDARRVERELGGRLDAGQAPVAGRQPGGHPARAYTTLPGSRGAKYKEACLQQRLPQLLGQRAYTHLVVQLPTPDITNLGEGGSKEEKYSVVEQTATATVAILEGTLRTNPTLQSILVLPRPPRADSDLLSELSEYSNSLTAAAIQSSLLSNQITMGTNSRFKCESIEDAIKIFGPKTSNNDGIHFRGSDGPSMYTDSIVHNIRIAGMGQSAASPSLPLPAGWSTQPRKGAARQQATTLPSNQGFRTSNQFNPLNC